jgi:hypothetical protein
MGKGKIAWMLEHLYQGEDADNFCTVETRMQRVASDHALIDFGLRQTQALA